MLNIFLNKHSITIDQKGLTADKMHLNSLNAPSSFCFIRAYGKIRRT